MCRGRCAHAVRGPEEDNRDMTVRLVVVIGAAALTVGCGGGEQAAKPQVETPVSGTLDVGGHELYFECVGTGSPTVVLEAGLGDTRTKWEDVQPQLGRLTRTCSYDRADLGASTRTAVVHDAGDEIRDLERLLDGADIEPPYLLVGHSYGGLLARAFAHEHPDQLAGVVLVDAMGRDQTKRQLAIVPATPTTANFRQEYGQPVVGTLDIRASEALASTIRTLGDVPLVVVTAARHTEIAGLPAPVRRALEAQWTTMQDELAALSPDHVHVVAMHSDHFVQSDATGQPAIVVDAVRAVVRAHRKGTQLAPCSRLFSSPAVRCRS